MLTFFTIVVSCCVAAMLLTVIDVKLSGEHGALDEAICGLYSMGRLTPELERRYEWAMQQEHPNQAWFSKEGPQT